MATGAGPTDRRPPDDRRERREVSVSQRGSGRADQASAPSSDPEADGALEPRGSRGAARLHLPLLLTQASSPEQQAPPPLSSLLSAPR
ncbi:hypothetical protein EYF80_061280 [Liparis tanakae]|uniref:Uncharacterized protein n=1 Tax=Liparis tanakae TaxID=230148 RepID=A0A4Z2EJQ3_9TELE|nr:hypothetical protein EYF80_061280 [Liparis tanakae]